MNGLKRNWPDGQAGQGFLRESPTICNIKEHSPWLWLIVLMDLFFSFIVWLAAPGAFGYVCIMLAIFTVIVVIAGIFIDASARKKKMAALQSFLSDFDESSEQMLVSVAGESWRPLIVQLSQKLREQEKGMNDKQLELQDYEEFIEEWTHEIKTPLSLATLVLANHRDEMSPYVYGRMNHVQHTIGGNVDRILYYARLHADHMDYKFETLKLDRCVDEALESFMDIAREKGIAVQTELLELRVVSDRKVLAFMLAQLLGNAFKYTAGSGGVVSVATWSGPDGEIHLAVRDNGSGVSAADLPFVFDKGFTGSFPNRQNATGMGLYLVKKYAAKLSVTVEIEDFSTRGCGFGIEIIFPLVE